MLIVSVETDPKTRYINTPTDLSYQRLVKTPQPLLEQNQKSGYRSTTEKRLWYRSSLAHLGFVDPAAVDHEIVDATDFGSLDLAK